MSLKSHFNIAKHLDYPYIKSELKYFPDGIYLQNKQKPSLTSPLQFSDSA